MPHTRVRPARKAAAKQSKPSHTWRHALVGGGVPQAARREAHRLPAALPQGDVHCDLVALQPRGLDAVLDRGAQVVRKLRRGAQRGARCQRRPVARRSNRRRGCVVRFWASSDSWARRMDGAQARVAERARRTKDAHSTPLRRPRTAQGSTLGARKPPCIRATGQGAHRRCRLRVVLNALQLVGQLLQYDPRHRRAVELHVLRTGRHRRQRVSTLAARARGCVPAKRVPRHSPRAW